METKNQGREQSKENLKEMSEVCFVCVCFGRKLTPLCFLFYYASFPYSKGGVLVVSERLSNDCFVRLSEFVMRRVERQLTQVFRM